MSNSTHAKLLFVSVVVAAVAMVIAMAGTVLYAQHLSQDRRAEQVAGCIRANQQRIYINKILEHLPEFRLAPIVIPDCSAIIK